MTRAEPLPPICFVAHFAYGALAGGENGHIGGVERQMSLMARWFAKRGYSVSVITWDEGQPDECSIDGIRIIKMCRKDEGIKGIRFFHPKWTSLNRALREADADLYYQNCGEYVTGQLALWCRRHERAFVYSVASDLDCDVHLPEMHTLRERLLYRYGLRQADHVITQTRRQEIALQEGFGLDSTVLPMPCPDLSDDQGNAQLIKRGNCSHILWIGRVCRQKNPKRLLDLAEANPDLSFDLVGPGSGSAYSDEVLERATGIPNVTVHGPVPRGQVGAFYRRAALLCCTSDWEGFPNTFIEAWSHGVPVVSNFDPDGLIAEHCLGAVANDVLGLSAGLRRLCDHPERYEQASRNARQYYLEHHAVNVAMPRFERVFLDVINSKGRASGR